MRQKKSNIGKNSRNARRNRLRRAQESEEQAAARKAAQRIRTAENRQRESLEQYVERLRKTRLRKRADYERYQASLKRRDREKEKTRRALELASFIDQMFGYEADIDYSKHSNITIHAMDYICQYSQEVKSCNELSGSKLTTIHSQTNNKDIQNQSDTINLDPYPKDTTIESVNLPKEINRKMENELLISSQSSTSYDSEKLLIPSEMLGNVSAVSNKQTIELNNDVDSVKKILAKLNEKVCNDSMDSPYVMSENIKNRMVNMYKELCTLNGTEPVTKRMINLKVIRGHPPGPVQILELFLNKKFDGVVDPPYPRFQDVVKCVLIANVRDNLGWSKPQVMTEAKSLFSNCCRTLQRRRMNNNAELLERLGATRRIALNEENEVFKRFAMIQNGVEKSIGAVMCKTEIDETNSVTDMFSENIEIKLENIPSPLATSSHTEQVNIKIEKIHEDEDILISNNTDSNINEVTIKKEPNITEHLETTNVINIEYPCVM